MGLFSRSKSKSRKDAKVEPPAEEQKPKAAYKHVPKHAAADSVGQGGRVDTHQERERIAMASRTRLQNSIYDSALGNASQTQMIAHEMAHGTPSPSVPHSLQQRRSRSLIRGQSGVSFTDSEAPPLPTSVSTRARSAGTRTPAQRYSSDYFSQLRTSTYEQVAQSYEHLAGKESSAQSAFHYPDSGYASGRNSQAPSLVNLQDDSKMFLQRNHSGFLPEFKVDSDTLQQQISRESASLQDASPVREQLQSFRDGSAEDSDNASPVEPDPESRVLKSHRSSPSVTKRTRFGDHPDPMPPLDRLQYHRDLPPPSQNEARQHPAYRSAEKPYLPPLEQISSPPRSRRGTLPPLSILAGLKVNKKGRILDEEGEPIGELVQGELLDCVRQKANADGEVIDEYGRTVGHVRTIAGSGSSRRVSSETKLAPAPEPKQSSPWLEKSMPLRSASPPGNYSSLPEVVTPELEDGPRSRPALSPQEAEHYNEPSASPTKVEFPEEQLQRPVEVQQYAPTTSIDFAAFDAPRRSPPLPGRRKSMEIPKRMAMSPVPENNVAMERPMNSGPAPFTYKGEIPAVDGPPLVTRSQPGSPMEARMSKVPAGIHPQSALYTQGASSFKRMDMGSRRFTTHFTGAYPTMNNNLKHRSVMPIPHGPSPLSSQETSPKRSETGTDSSEERRPGMIHGRTSSMHSAASSARPRSYFTHSGRVTVDPNTPKPEQPAETKPVEPAPVEQKTLDKKKSRLSMGFGKKKTAAK